MDINKCPLNRFNNSVIYGIRLIMMICHNYATSLPLPLIWYHLYVVLRQPILLILFFLCVFPFPIPTPIYHCLVVCCQDCCCCSTRPFPDNRCCSCRFLGEDNALPWLLRGGDRIEGWERSWSWPVVTPWARVLFSCLFSEGQHRGYVITVCLA